LELTSPWTSVEFWRESSGGDDGEYHSLSLPGLLGRLDGDRKYQILDLGAAHGATVEFFSRYSCKLYVADLHRSLLASRSSPGPLADGLAEAGAEPNTEEDEEAAAAERARAFDNLLPYEEDTRFDLILAWDLLNYLEPEQIEFLGRRLSNFSNGSTKLFAMVAIHQEIPARPCAFRIRDPETLEFDALTDRTRPAPRHAEPALRRLMAGFDVESTCVLRNGLQEYVFSFAPGQAHRRAG